MDRRPIGVFDSGLGGLTAVRELRSILPGEDIVYFGDTGRVPYGSRGRDTIITYTRQDIAFLLSRGVKAILAACGTASSTFPKPESDALPVGYMGVVEPTAAAAVKATNTGRVGVIGTEATIASGSYRRALKALDGGIETVEAACPLYVPLVENGHFGPNDPLARLVTEEYLEPVRKAGVDTLILGCTHYPLLAEVIGAYMGEGVTLVDSGRQAALAMHTRLQQQNLLGDSATGGTTRYFVSDDPAKFERLASIFLRQSAGGCARRVEIEEYGL